MTMRDLGYPLSSGDALCGDMYRAIKDDARKQTERKVMVFLGELEDAETDDKLKYLALLKRDNAIVASSIVRESKDEEIEGDHISRELVYAECTLQPANFVQYARKKFKPKFERVSALASHVALLVKLLALHTVKVGEIDPAANDEYLRLTGEIDRLLKEGKSSSQPSLRQYYPKPFSDLYAAYEELRERKTTIGDAIGSLNAFFGVLRHLQSLYAFGSLKKVVLKKQPMTLHDVKLDEYVHQVVLNGDKPFSLVSRQGDASIKGDTKRFRILRDLWETKRLIKRGKMAEKGEYVLLSRLVRPSEGTTKDAVRKHIARLNERFAKEGVSIHVDSNKRGAYMIVVKLD